MFLIYVWFCKSHYLMFSFHWRKIRHQRTKNLTSMQNAYSQKIQQPMTNKNIWSRFALKLFTLLSSAVNSSAVISVILTSARLVAANDLLSSRRKQRGRLSLHYVNSSDIQLKASRLTITVGYI